MNWHRSGALRRALASIAVFGVATGGLAAVSVATAGAASTRGYNSIPSVLPGNVASTGFEATSTSELGDSVSMSSGGKLHSAQVVMSSWGCEAGSWFAQNCTTTPGSTFSHPITFNVYAVGIGGQPGALLASKTQTFAIPFRPSADGVNCTGGNAGKWFNGTTCFNGYATTITFDFSATQPTLPANVIWSVAYNTTHYGSSPIGESAPCYGTPQGCGYDSLNVGDDNAGAPNPSAGTDTDPDGAVLSSTWAGAYCDGGAGGTGTLRVDTSAGCWAGFRPEGRLRLYDAIPKISTASVTVPEGSSGPTIVNVPVTLSDPSTNTVTVKWKTRSGSATLTDYTASSGTLTLPSGTTSAVIPITVNGDMTVENFESFFVDLTVPTNATLDPPGSKITSTIQLTNDDKPTLKFVDIVTTEGSPASESFTLSRPYYQQVVLTLNTANGTAVQPGDYDPLVNVQVTIPAGSVGPVTVPLTVKTDTVVEPLERFTVTATSPSVSNSGLVHKVAISNNAT